MKRGALVELLATGALSPLLLPVAWLARQHFGLAPAELAIGFLTFHAASVINDPHFAVTYVLFYRDARNRALSPEWPSGWRARYWLAGLVVPALLIAWTWRALVTCDPDRLGMMVQLMLLLVGWHYVKQGFGVLLTLSARRGALWSPRERRVLLAHAIAAWGFAFANPADEGREVEEKGVVFRMLPHPAWLERITLALFAATFLVLVVTLVRKVRREGKWPPPVPLSAYLVTLWMWTIWSAFDPLVVYVIPALHSIQYLFFVALVTRGRARAEEGEPRFGPPFSSRIFALGVGSAILGWVILRGAPAWLDATFVPHSSLLPDAVPAVGATPFLAAFSTFVNVHHYVMDAVLWRRESPEARYLREA